MSEGDEIRIEVTRSKRDYSSAIWLNYWRGGGALLHLLIAAGIGAWGFVETVGELGPVRGLGAGAVGGLTVFAIILFFQASMTSTGMTVARTPGALEPTEFAFSPTGIDVKTPLANGRVLWAAYKDWFENGRVLVIRQRGRALQVLPKKQIGAASLTRLRTLLRSALDRKASS